MNIAARPQTHLDHVTEGTDSLLVPVDRVDASRQVHKESIESKNIVLAAIHRLNPVERAEIAAALLSSLMETNGTIEFLSPTGIKRIVVTDV